MFFVNDDQICIKVAEKGRAEREVESKIHTGNISSGPFEVIPFPYSWKPKNIFNNHGNDFNSTLYTETFVVMKDDHLNTMTGFVSDFKINSPFFAPDL